MADGMAIDHQNLAVCIAQAAQLYQADGAKVASLVVSRGGRTGEIRRRADGDIEIGLTRIPGREAEALRSHGITAQMLAENDCLNITIATYLLQRDTQQQQGTRANAVPVVAGGRDEYCLQTAAARYAIPIEVMRAVVATEGGSDGLRKRNRNGSYDLGRAQINTVHLEELARYGVSEQQLVSDACVNLHVAAYRLRFEINRVGEFWKGVGNYHSRTPSLSQAYVGRVRRRLPATAAESYR